MIFAFLQPPLLSVTLLCLSFFKIILTYLLPCLLLLPFPPVGMKTPGEQGPLCQEALSGKRHGWGGGTKELKEGQ